MRNAIIVCAIPTFLLNQFFVCRTHPKSAAVILCHWYRMCVEILLFLYHLISREVMV